jgi:hypothetical protein
MRLGRNEALAVLGRLRDECPGGPALRLHHGHRPLRRLGITIGDEDARAVPREHHRRGAAGADPVGSGSAAGDHRDLAVEPHDVRAGAPGHWS